jgi:hypothetical protein
MDWPAWRKALGLYLNTPELIYASILVAFVIFGFAWWLRSHISKERALKDRLRLGKEEQERITKELETLQRGVSQQQTIIDNLLRFTEYAQRSQVDLLSAANATVVSSLTNLAQANTELGVTLTAGTSHVLNSAAPLSTSK